jgi:hypothetical protein
MSRWQSSCRLLAKRRQAAYLIPDIPQTPVGQDTLTMTLILPHLGTICPKGRERTISEQ